MGLLRKSLTAALAFGGMVMASSLERVNNFGENDSHTKMYIYVPDRVVPNPAIVVAMHYCADTATGYFGSTPYAGLADVHGFLVIYPESPYGGTCWDISSPAALSHDGGGDSNSIANMVIWTLDKFHADASRVYAVGSLSGAMMTNVLAATYPDLFAAAVVYSGVPHSCFYTGTENGWNSTCSSGQLNLTQEYWAGKVEEAYPGYNGSRPRMRIHHGLADTTISPQNYFETIKQWTGVFGYPEKPSQTYPNNPAIPYTRYVYGPNVEGVLGQGITHEIDQFGEADMEWFGLTGFEV
ncbi:putative acetyl xylan esterase [Poronia punctata]|nr:putative acetyl xylan esterase [Poronia punctata]